MVDIAWAAGLFEGEGTITIRTRPEDQIELQLSSVDEDVVRAFADVVGDGHVYGPYQYGDRQAFWKWSAYGAVALAVLQVFRPYLLARRGARADEAIERYLARQARPFYSVSRKGMGGQPTHALSTDDTRGNR